MPYQTVRYSLEGMRLSHRILVIIANEHPDGITAQDVSNIFYKRDYKTIYHTLQRLVIQGFLRRCTTEEKADNHHPMVLYFATRKAKKKVNYLMRRRFGGDWEPLPLYSDGPNI